MDSTERGVAAFARGFADVFREQGLPVPEMSIKEAEDLHLLWSLSCSPGISAVKEAALRRPGSSFWDKAKKWLIGAGALALGAGWWGTWNRYAKATGNPRGPITGPILGLRDRIRDTALGELARQWESDYREGAYGANS